MCGCVYVGVIDRVATVAISRVATPPGFAYRPYVSLFSRFIACLVALGDSYNLSKRTFLLVCSEPHVSDTPVAYPESLPCGSFE